MFTTIVSYTVVTQKILRNLRYIWIPINLDVQIEINSIVYTVKTLQYATVKTIQYSLYIEIPPKHLSV